MHVLITARTFWDFTKTYFSENQILVTSIFLPLDKAKEVSLLLKNTENILRFEIRKQLANDPNTI